jgi:hypothetical protein
MVNQRSLIIVGIVLILLGGSGLLYDRINVKPIPWDAPAREQLRLKESPLVSEGALLQAGRRGLIRLTPGELIAL